MPETLFLEAVGYATLEWAGWLNHRRLLEPVGNISPTRRGGHGGLTQTNRSPEFPGRFIC
ncbi:MAG TPA: hypothetical protein ENH21_02120 [Chromatiales bacterium]|nr:hypothetical protein [Chromatiales bacterium]HEX22209.1 hypothetical protein [Chromatiales bacterium]